MNNAELRSARLDEHRKLLERAARADDAARALTAGDESRRQAVEGELAALRDALEAHLRWEDDVLLQHPALHDRESVAGLQAAHHELFGVLDFCRDACGHGEHAALLARRVRDLVELVRGEIVAEERSAARTADANAPTTPISTVSRPFRPIALTTDVLRLFQLGDLARELTTEESYRASGVASVTLARGEDVTLVLVALRAGAIMREHRAPSAATVVLLSGRASFVSGFDARRTEMTAGTLAAFSADVPHSLQAVEDAAYLVIIGGRSRPSDE